MHEYEVTLTYFKPSGKYYTEGTYKTTRKWMYEVSEEVKKMRDTGQLPGINGKEWIIHIAVEESHPNGYPCLLLIQKEAAAEYQKI